MNISSIIITEQKGRRLGHKMIDKVSDPFVRIWARNMLSQYLSQLDIEQRLTLGEFNNDVNSFIQAAHVIVETINRISDEDCDDSGEESC
jgi:hypothetical protein